MKLKLLAIDPGTTQSGFCVWSGDAIHEADKISNVDLLQKIRCGHFERNEVNLVAIEKVASYGMAVGAETFEAVFWSGRFAEAWLSKGIQGFVRRPARLEVKLHLCHSPRANDSTIRQALIDRFGAPGTKANKGFTYGLAGDQWQAFALAVTVFDSEQEMLAKQAKPTA